MFGEGRKEEEVNAGIEVHKNMYQGEKLTSL